MESSYKGILQSQLKDTIVELVRNDDLNCTPENALVNFEQHKDDVMDVLTKGFFDLCSYWQQFGFMDKKFNVGYISNHILETIQFQQIVDDDEDDDDDIYEDTS